MQRPETTTQCSTHPLRVIRFVAATALLLVVQCAAASAASLNPDALATIVARGSTYEVGRAVGAAFADFIAARARSPYMLATFEYVQTGVGRAAYEGMLGAAQRTFPEYVAELHGLADGAGLSREDVVVMYMADDLAIVNGSDAAVRARRGGRSAAAAAAATAAAAGAPAHLSERCTDVLVRAGGGAVLIGHNEDDDAVNLGRVFMLDATITADNDSSVVLERFVALTYPGELSGAAFGYNAAGVVLSINALFPVAYDTGAVPSYMVTRYMLGASSLDDAVARARSAVAVGWNANIAQVRAFLSAAARAVS